MLSLCIPVYNSEPYVEKCLESAVRQGLGKELEILVLNDGSSSTDEKGRDCKKIVKQFAKKNHCKINYIKHDSNKGLVEARRTLTYEAKGEYVFFMDSDDMLVEGALAELLETARKTDADIVHGKTLKFNIENCFEDNESQCNFDGFVEGHQIFHNMIVNRTISSFVCGKIFKRELLLEAFDKIPPTYCNMAEDYVISFFVFLYAKSYYGVNKPVYLYRKTSGMTSKRKIDSIEKWRQICSTSSVFTIIFSWLQEFAMGTDLGVTKEEIGYVGYMSKFYLKNNLLQLETAVDEKLKPEALEMLYDYWGESFVKSVQQERQEGQTSLQN